MLYPSAPRLLDRQPAAPIEFCLHHYSHAMLVPSSVGNSGGCLCPERRENIAKKSPPDTVKYFLRNTVSWLRHSRNWMRARKLNSKAFMLYATLIKKLQFQASQSSRSAPPTETLEQVIFPSTVMPAPQYKL
mmetsp:Transcript_8130/g.13312  ORF Transcript_8130/g.13312 Transcript_8130/m.13312 type:complete len:132 (-) Transcript_8130:612-1007(-)